MIITEDKFSETTTSATVVDGTCGCLKDLDTLWHELDNVDQDANFEGLKGPSPVADDVTSLIMRTANTYEANVQVAKALVIGLRWVLRGRPLR